MNEKIMSILDEMAKKKMSPEDALSRLREKEEEAPATEEDVMHFLVENPEPTDVPDDIADTIYSLAAKFSKFMLVDGKSNQGEHQYDSKEIEAGMKVEAEHSSEPMIQHKISSDHCAEFPKYYSEILGPAEKKAKK